MVMWIHWNACGSRPAAAFAHLPAATAAAGSSSLAWALGPRLPLGQPPFPAGAGPSWGLAKQRHQNSPGIVHNTVLARAPAESPVRQGG